MVLWVFGYGSLVWNPGFDFDERVVGFIKDYKRVFDLACIDHRGTPENPARTCTLESHGGAVCWGAAYCIRGGDGRKRTAMEYLERRECEYDRKSSVDFYTEDNEAEPTLRGVLVFTSTPDRVSNKYYLGPAPLDVMARQIATASGPSGNNREYLLLLEKAMFDIGHPDDYVIELASEVRKVLEEEENAEATSRVVKAEKKKKNKKKVAAAGAGDQVSLFLPASFVILSPLSETTTAAVVVVGDSHL